MTTEIAIVPVVLRLSPPALCFEAGDGEGEAVAVDERKGWFEGALDFDAVGSLFEGIFTACPGPSWQISLYEPMVWVMHVPKGIVVLLPAQEVLM